MKILIKRVYDPSVKEDGVRLFVDRLWPRGVKKEGLVMDAWLKDLAPTTELRKWFGHNPERFKEFEKLYGEELDESKAIWEPLLRGYLDKTITLLYAAKDPEINHAQCLKRYLTKHHWSHLQLS